MIVIEQKHVLILLIFLIFLYIFINKREGFSVIPRSSNEYDYQYYYNPHNISDLPYYGDPYPFTISSRSTRNMSYDLRGDVPVTYQDVGPWNNSTRGPIYNRPLASIS
jgi:hypothetical protein